MALIRSIGRWTMTALVINSIIGSGIFGVPGELTRLLGRASPFAMIFAALGMAVIMACFAEVASQFSEPGGSYLYVRTAFGRFAGIQVAWFNLLALAGGLAAVASLFADYFAVFLPWSENIWIRGLLLAIVIGIPTVLNYLGVRDGAALNNLTTVAKLLPLVLLISLGVARFVHQPQMLHVSEIAAPGVSKWVNALVLLVFAYGGWQDGLIATGETRDPRRTIPFGLGAGLFACAAIYTLIQFITVTTIGARLTDRPVTETASLLMGSGGATFVTIAVLLSTYGNISAAMLCGPRLSYSLAAQGDFPPVFAREHPRFHTPTIGILFYALTAWVLASSGTFLWIVAVTAGSMLVLYAAICGSLMRLRKLRSNEEAFQIPFGPVLSIAGVAIAVWLMTGLQRRELLLMGITSLIAAANWLWARRHRPELETKEKVVAAPLSPH